MALFKRKKGGTRVGNLLRKVGNVFTGGSSRTTYQKPKPRIVTVSQVSNKVPAKTAGGYNVINSTTVPVGAPSGSVGALSPKSINIGGGSLGIGGGGGGSTYNPSIGAQNKIYGISSSLGAGDAPSNVSQKITPSR